MGARGIHGDPDLEFHGHAGPWMRPNFRDTLVPCYGCRCQHPFFVTTLPTYGICKIRLSRGGSSLC